jgi:hypothetical protein
MTTTVQIAIDCADPARLAEFWAAALGHEVQGPPEGYESWPGYLQSQGIPEDLWNSASAVVDPARAAPRFYFQRVPEPKTVKNRMHVDLKVSGGDQEKLDAEQQRLTGLGATMIGKVEEFGQRWIVMQDPEGNEFCLS